MFRDRNDIRSSDLRNRNTSVGCVGGVEINVIGSDTGSNGELKLLGLGETVGGEISWVEAFEESNPELICGCIFAWACNLRGSYDDLGIDELLIKGAVLAFFVACRHESVAIILQPFSNAKFILSCT